MKRHLDPLPPRQSLRLVMKRSPSRILSQSNPCKKQANQNFTHGFTVSHPFAEAHRVGS